MMGDTNVETVQPHYFNFDDDDDGESSTGGKLPTKTVTQPLASLEDSARSDQLAGLAGAAPLSLKIRRAKPRRITMQSLPFTARKNALLRVLMRVCSAGTSKFLLSQIEKRRQVAASVTSDHRNLAGPTGLEPATSGVTGRRSNKSRLSLPQRSTSYVVANAGI